MHRACIRKNIYIYAQIHLRVSIGLSLKKIKPWDLLLKSTNLKKSLRNLYCGKKTQVTKQKIRLFSESKLSLGIVKIHFKMRQNFQKIKRHPH